MAPVDKCKVCEENIRTNSPAIKCNHCDCWIHKKCTDLTNEEFTKLASTSKKHSHKWVCSICLSAEVSIIVNEQDVEKNNKTVIDKMEALFCKYFLPFKIEIEKTLTDIKSNISLVVEENQRLKEENQAMWNKLNQLERIYNTISNALSSEGVISEINERKRRESNVIAFNVSESRRQTKKREKRGGLQLSH